MVFLSWFGGAFSSFLTFLLVFVCEIFKPYWFVRIKLLMIMIPSLYKIWNFSKSEFDRNRSKQFNHNSIFQSETILSCCFNEVIINKKTITSSILCTRRNVWSRVEIGIHGKENGRQLLFQLSNLMKLMKVDALDYSVLVSGNVFKRLTYLLILQTADIVCFKLKNNVVTDLGARSGVLSPHVF